MSETECKSLFPVGTLNQPEIAPEMRDTFIPLAQRAGNSDEVDSCDMENYYEEYKVPQQQRPSSRDYFLDQSLGQDLRAQVNFDYKKFFAHLVSVAHPFSYSTLRDAGGAKNMWDGARKPGETVQMLLERKPGDLFMDKIERLATQYPFWIGDKVKIGEPLLLIGMSLETTFSCDGLVCAPLNHYAMVAHHPNGSWLVSVIDSDWKSNVQYFDVGDKQVYWFIFQHSSPTRTDLNPYGIANHSFQLFLENQYPNKNQGRKFWDPAKITTNITPAAWNRLKGVKVFKQSLRLTDHVDSLVKNKDSQF